MQHGHQRKRDRAPVSGYTVQVRRLWPWMYCGASINNRNNCKVLITGIVWSDSRWLRLAPGRSALGGRERHQRRGHCCAVRPSHVLRHQPGSTCGTPPLVKHTTCVRRRYFHCFNQRDRDGMLSLLADTCTYRSLAFAGTFSGKQVGQLLPSNSNTLCSRALLRLLAWVGVEWSLHATLRLAWLLQ